MNSEDGGKTFTNMDETAKHGDNHAMALKPQTPTIFWSVQMEGFMKVSIWELPGATWKTFH